jgi:hypothetical protein
MRKVKRFFFALKKEKKETAYVSKLLYANLVKKRKLKDSQKILIKKQSINVFKVFFVVTIFIFPFGSLILIGINFFPFRKYVFPSNFLKYFFENS